ncbi:hypothetical protein ACFW6F_21810 [Streptomyces sp. NPDC058746]|uniref:hypothetical protein n=1 Tax=Streptomyces sp. NPDC058746 TaxID=3346622 RepID=UPI0036B3FDB0
MVHDLLRVPPGDVQEHPVQRTTHQLYVDVPPAHSAHSFRYLAAGDYWFNDDTADSHHGPNSRIHT